MIFQHFAKLYQIALQKNSIAVNGKRLILQY